MHSLSYIFCGQEEETVGHPFSKCDISRMFWSEFKMSLHENCASCFNFPFSKEVVLFGTITNCTTDKSIELIILLAKFYVCRVQYMC